MIERHEKIILTSDENNATKYTVEDVKQYDKFKAMPYRQNIFVTGELDNAPVRISFEIASHKPLRQGHISDYLYSYLRRYGVSGWTITDTGNYAPLLPYDDLIASFEDDKS